MLHYLNVCIFIFFLSWCIERQLSYFQNFLECWYREQRYCKLVVNWCRYILYHLYNKIIIGPVHVRKNFMNYVYGPKSPPDVIRFIIIVTKIAQDTTKTQAFNCRWPKQEDFSSPLLPPNMYFMVEHFQKTQYQCGSVLTVSRVFCKYNPYLENHPCQH